MAGCPTGLCVPRVLVYRTEPPRMMIGSCNGASSFPLVFDNGSRHIPGDAPVLNHRTKLATADELTAGMPGAGLREARRPPACTSLLVDCERPSPILPDQAVKHQTLVANCSSALTVAVHQSCQALAKK